MSADVDAARDVYSDPARWGERFDTLRDLLHDDPALCHGLPHPLDDEGHQRSDECDRLAAAIRAEYIRSQPQSHYDATWQKPDPTVRAEGLDAERLMRAADIVTETVDITPWTPIWWREVAAEYARPGMSELSAEPRTAAGRALLAMLTANDGYAPFTEDILAIEAEARAECESECRGQLDAERAAALDEARAAVERERLIEGLANDGDTAYNHAIDDALAAIDALREGAG